MRKRICGRRKAIIILCFLCLTINAAISQIKKWDGGAGDGQWSSASNWSDDILPASGDSVVLDNSMLTGNYNVLLPTGNSGISLRWLTVSPAGSIIQIRIPN